MNGLGRELTICPAKRPAILNAVCCFGVVVICGLGLFGFAAAPSVASDSAVTGLLVIGAVFLGIGILLLVLRQRKLQLNLIYRIFEGGVVRETSSGQNVLPFVNLDRIHVEVVNHASGRKIRQYLQVTLVARHGEKMKLAGYDLDNFDETTIAILERQSGQRVEPG